MYPSIPEKILVPEKYTNSTLCVGQTGSSVYPICYCHLIAARVNPSTSYWVCDVTGHILTKFITEPYDESHSLGVNNPESGPEGPGMVRRAIANWCKIPYEDLDVRVEL